MADEPKTGRTFTEGEAYALVNDSVARETAAAQVQIEELTTANAALSTKVDTLETEKAAAISRAEAAEQAHEAFKSELEEKAAKEAKRDERLREVAEANPVLDLTDEARIARIVNFDDEGFQGYLADMRAVASQNPVTPPVTPGAPPRESAALQPTGGTGDAPKASLASLRAAGRSLTQTGV
jgi:hypothetical protein